jgi:putative phosphonate transport system ATP-binding protein
MSGEVELEPIVTSNPVEDDVVLRVEDLTVTFPTRDGPVPAVNGVSFSVAEGQTLGIVGESGSGKTTLLQCLAGKLSLDAGEVRYDSKAFGTIDLASLSEARRRLLARTEWGFVSQDAREGLRMNVSAGGNIGERLMAVGERHYGNLRGTADDWLRRVEIESDRLDDRPSSFSGGMRQRLQIARNLVTHPRLVFMDEPTGGLDVSVQARVLDLLRGLVDELHLSVLLVTHDLGVARLLTHRLMVMQGGSVVESGLTDQVLDDPQHAYTQTLVASILPV